MKDVFLFVIGMLSIMYMGWSQINRFRKGEFNPKLFSGGKGVKSSIACFIAVVVVWVMKDSILEDIYVLIFISVLGGIESIICLLLYRSDKDKKNIFRFVVNVGMSVFFIVLFIKICEW